MNTSKFISKSEKNFTFKVVLSIDNIIEVTKKSFTQEQAKQDIMKEYGSIWKDGVFRPLHWSQVNISGSKIVNMPA